MNPWYQKRGTAGPQNHTLEAGMYTISKTFGPFCTSHHLRGLPADHQCGRPHGHNYYVTLELQSSTIDEIGFVVDYGALKSFEEETKRFMDHQNLNEKFPFNTINPTAENLAAHLFQQAKSHTWGSDVSGVGVSETDKTWAWYRP